MVREGGYERHNIWWEKKIVDKISKLWQLKLVGVRVLIAIHFVMMHFNGNYKPR